MIWFCIGVVVLTVVALILCVAWIERLENEGMPEVVPVLLLVGFGICVFVVIKLFQGDIKTASTWAGPWSWMGVGLLFIVLVMGLSERGKLREKKKKVES